MDSEKQEKYVVEYILDKFNIGIIPNNIKIFNLD